MFVNRPHWRGERCGECLKEWCVGGYLPTYTTLPLPTYLPTYLHNPTAATTANSGKRSPALNHFTVCIIWAGVHYPWSLPPLYSGEPPTTSRPTWPRTCPRHPPALHTHQYYLLSSSHLQFATSIYGLPPTPQLICFLHILPPSRRCEILEERLFLLAPLQSGIYHLSFCLCSDHHDHVAGPRRSPPLVRLPLLFIRPARIC